MTVRPLHKPGELVYFRFRGLVGAILPYMPDPETHQVLIVGCMEGSTTKIGEVVNAHPSNLTHFHPLEGIQFLPP